ncbi:MAG TPA: hypothetical protein VNA16_11425 [Abditibacteriaceae bacterium]|nr:hypothetical protein [Abditibacteriaceae bacterium]
MDMQEFADALASKDVNRYGAWFADDMKLFTPIYEEPMIGKETACQMLPVVFSVFENFHYPDVLSGETTHALFFRAEIEGVLLEGVDYIETDASGRVTSFSVMMRPLKAITALTKGIAARMQASGGTPNSAPPTAGQG